MPHTVNSADNFKSMLEHYCWTVTRDAPFNEEMSRYSIGLNGVHNRFCLLFYNTFDS